MVRKDDSEARLEVAKIIAGGGVIAFRTDTFYGLGADPFNASAVRKIRELKGREDNKPILLLISDREQVDRFIGNQTSLFKSVANHFWPGPITLIGSARPELPAELTASTETIGVRLPNDDDVRSLVRACGGALTATSANPSSSNPASTAAEVEAYFPVGLDMILDGGPSTITEPSTVVDLTTETLRVVREGAIKREELDRCVRRARADGQ